MSSSIEADYRVDGGVWSSEAPAPRPLPNPFNLWAEELERRIAEGVAAGMVQIQTALGEVVGAVTAFIDAMLPLRVPTIAVRVRPVGGRSNSRTWLAWDHDRWRPCWRMKGVWYWS